MDLLSRIRVVLVEPRHPGNIGSAARALMNMGLRDLVLVGPARFPDPEATALAAGAETVLERARVCATLAEAVADCTRVIATTARTRHVVIPFSTPRECAEKLAAGAYAGNIALVFGRERTGLTNDELDAAQEAIAIPTDPVYGSMNLAAAVQIVCYEMRIAAGAKLEGLTPHEPVTQEGFEHFSTHLERVITRTGFLDPDKPRFIMRRLRRLFGRAAPDDQEMAILRGILTSVEEALDGDSAIAGNRMRAKRRAAGHEPGEAGA